MARTTIARGGMAARGKGGTPPVVASRTSAAPPMGPPRGAAGLQQQAFKKGGKVKRKGKK